MTGSVRCRLSTPRLSAPACAPSAQQQGLSLQGVEEKSAGRWKAVVVGSYERGDRAVTVSRLAELADFYGVPVAELLPEGSGVAARAHQQDRAGPGAAATTPPTRTWPRGPLRPAIQQQRGDYNGKVLSIRADDLRALAIIYDKSPPAWSSGSTSTACWSPIRAASSSPSPVGPPSACVGRRGR